MADLGMSQWHLNQNTTMIIQGNEKCHLKNSDHLVSVSMCVKSICRQNISRTLLCRQCNCWSLRCSWSFACRRCSNYNFILDWSPGFNGLGKGNCKTRRETFKFWDLVGLISEILRYCGLWLKVYRDVNSSEMAWCGLKHTEWPIDLPGRQHNHH